MKAEDITPNNPRLFKELRYQYICGNEVKQGVVSFENETKLLHSFKQIKRNILFNRNTIID